jgi:hypothetical protein
VSQPARVGDRAPLRFVHPEMAEAARELMQFDLDAEGTMTMFPHPARDRRAAVVVAFLLAIGTDAAVAQAQPFVAGELFVGLDALHSSAGTDIWSNTGSLGDFNRIGNPLLGLFGTTDQPGVQFDSVSAYRGPIAPASITGVNPRSIEVWAFNPTVEAHETMVGWGRRGGPAGTNMSFTYGTNTSHGAAGHWGASHDMNWNEIPTGGSWQHLVYTYDGITVRLYANGLLDNSRALTLNTHDGMPINLGAQNVDALGNLFGSERFTGALATVRVHDGVLTSEQVLANFRHDKLRFGAIERTPPPPPRQLVSLWRFNDSNNLGLDSAETGNTLTPQGNAAHTADGRHGGALALDGAGSMLDSAAFPTGVPTGNSSYTVAAWIQPTIGGDRGIIGWGNYGGVRQVNALRVLGANGFRHYWWGADLDANDAQVAAAGVTLTDGQWHHVAAVYDNQAGMRRLYLNGNLLVSGPPGANNAQPVNFAVGRTCTFCGGGEFFIGSLDDVGVFDIPLTQAQIQAIMSGDFSEFIDSSLPGDLNEDGAVNRWDAVRLAANYGRTDAEGPIGGDANGDFAAGLSDLRIVQINMGVSPGAAPSAAAVPEPSAFALAAGAAAFFMVAAGRGGVAARRKI